MHSYFIEQKIRFAISFVAVCVLIFLFEFALNRTVGGERLRVMPRPLRYLLSGLGYSVLIGLMYGVSILLK